MVDPSPSTPIERLGRAAIFTFGAAIATTASACAGSVTPAYGAAAVDTAVPQDSAPGDAAMMMAHYGGPPIDAGVDMGGSSSDYGAPPPPDASGDA